MASSTLDNLSRTLNPFGSLIKCCFAADNQRWIVFPCQDKLSYHFLKICSTPHTLASALPVLSFTINTTSAFTPHTLDNSRHIITWYLGLGSSDLSVCVKNRVRRRCTESFSTNRHRYYTRCSVAYLAYLSMVVPMQDQQLSLRRPESRPENPTHLSFPEAKSL